MTERIIHCAIEVHKELGPGLLESVYEEALAIELNMAGLACVRQVEVRVAYKGIPLLGGFRADLVVELKTADSIVPVHEAQLLSYMKLGGWKIGLLLNFKCALLRDGIRRFAL